MSINYNIEQLKNSIYKEINNSNLPVGVIYLLLKDIFRDVSEAYQNAYIQEIGKQFKDNIQTQEEKINGETISSSD